MRKSLLAILCISIATAGCFGGADDDNDVTPDPTPPPPIALETETFFASGTLLIGTENMAEATCGLLGEGIDRAVHTWDIPADVDGTAARVANLTVVLTIGPSGIDLDLHVFGPDGDLVGSGTDFNPTTDNTETVVGHNLPPGSYRIEVHACTGAASNYTVEGTADLVVA